ncbi:enoyl-CoA hydratase/isomerase (macronuclear) [Tetrahymena thermophila SB210]|uniref:3-hydroxyisobutyryl-CoA hydrolase n=1 Tax=Tetrahymena thermophila (strain SB210) TaxID=312017 RepID=Q22N60_TETTS|nr:enoyl-CoA hydratase/isomerase [Tetrahymena thermophila SB210]EAR86925.1 enoyl-CoA hydratase/isomerase [Tetrahymena thermophila SB210]|eukprot:XP_001007170.1 enoyl-CoA hydratase/isomerase [Tetrahymena thermophila SB210]
MERINTISNQISNKQSYNDFLIVNELPYQKVLVELNNTRRNNAINTQMSKQLMNIVQDPNYKIVILKGTYGKAFGCGGDVKDLYSYITNPDKTLLFDYFLTEFQNNYCYYLLNHMENCGSIAIYDGFTIGEAFLLSCYSKIKICTERTVIMMPECKNGLVIYTPQYFYGLKNNIGTYLWMTGEQVKGYDCIRFGLADFYIQSQFLTQMERELILAQDMNQCKSICQKYADMSADFIQYSDNTKLFAYIQDNFELRDFKDFWNNLLRNAHQKTDLELQKFSLKCLQQINQASRISIRFNFNLLQMCSLMIDVEKFNLLQIKAAINATFLYKDCIEGLKKAVVQKNYQPQWSHESFLDVKDSELLKIKTTDEFIQNEKLRIDLLMQIARQMMNRKQSIILQQNYYQLPQIIFDD